MTKEDLWDLDPYAFNRYRAENDLVDLLAFFKKDLPLFNEWLSEFEITDEEFCEARSTGNWLSGASRSVMIKYNEAGKIIADLYDRSEQKNNSQRWNSNYINICEVKNYTPYIYWAADRSGRPDFIISGSSGKMSYADLEYRGWVERPNSKAIIHDKHEVLKLGEYVVEDGVNISDRNLDFVDLDYLVIRGKFHGSNSTKIGYSSCREITFVDSVIVFTEFRKCYVDSLRMEDSYFQEIEFKECRLQDFQCSRSEISGLEVVDCFFAKPIFRASNVERVNYKPIAHKGHIESAISACTRLRMVLASSGRHKESQEYFYRQRCFERKALWNPYYRNYYLFPNRSYTGTLLDLYKQWTESYFSNSESARHLLSLFCFHFYKWIQPRSLFHSARFKLSYVISLVSYIIWGYGVRPMRVLLFSASIILIFAAIYLRYEPSVGDIPESLYFSIVTFTTLGYGDIQPTGRWVRLGCALQAILGALSMGMFVGSLARTESN